MRDRVFAARCADRAINLLDSNYNDCRVVGIQNGQMIDMEINEALNMKNVFDEELYKIANKLSF